MRGALLVLLVGCGGGGSDSPADAPGADAAYDTARCLITGHYGDLGSKTGMPTNGFPSSMSVVIDAGPPRDNFFVNLKPMGVFAGGLQTGTFTIQGVEAAQTTCGLCVSLIADIVTGSGPTKFYHAISGTVTITATTPAAGSVSNVMFQEVTSGGGAVPGGCVGSIGALTFGP